MGIVTGQVEGTFSVHPYRQSLFPKSKPERSKSRVIESNDPHTGNVRVIVKVRDQKRHHVTPIINMIGGS